MSFYDVTLSVKSVSKESEAEQVDNQVFPSFDGSLSSKTHNKRDLKSELCSDKLFMYLPTKLRISIRSL